MSQWDVIEVMEEERRPLKSKEIYKLMRDKGHKLSHNTVKINLSKVLSWNKPNVIRIYPDWKNRPRYMLEKYATEEQIEMMKDEENKSRKSN